MEGWITVKNAAGAIQGGGPITSVMNWHQDKRIDEPGNFNFVMPASDVRWRLIQPQYSVEYYVMLDGAVTLMGGGIVESVDEQAGTPSTVLVSGSDLLRELSYYPVGKLNVTEKGYTYLNGTNGNVAQLKPTYFTYADPTNGKHYKSGVYNRALILWHARDADVNTEDNYTVRVGTERSHYVPDTYDWLYIGCDKPFDKIRITIGTVTNTTVSTTIDYQYFAGANGWTSITGVTDGTVSGGKPFAQSGVIEYTEPADWERIQGINGLGNWFWVRARIILTDPWAPYYVSFRLKEVEVYVDLPTDTGPSLITARATAYNASWDTCATTSTNDAYLTFNGESVLTALQQLARATGDHFTLGTGRAITWLGAASTWSASGYTAVGGVNERAVGNLLIQSLTRSRVADDLITRITPLAGDSQHEVDLSKTTRTAPAGYTLGKAPAAPTQPWLKHDAAETAYGKISRVERFDNIEALNIESWYLDPTHASNQLFDAAKLYLDNRRSINYEYTFSVVGFEPYAVSGATTLPTPGTTIHVVYREYHNGEESLDIDTYAAGAALNIVKVSYTLGTEGYIVCNITASTAERLRRQAADDIADAITAQRY